MRKKILAIYTGEHSVLAAVITITGLVALSTAGIIIIKTTTSGSDVTASTTPAQTSETASTLKETTSKAETTAEETTTEEITTEEPTTEEPTTEAPTEPPTTKKVPETIPIEEISTVAQKEAEKFDAQEEARKELAKEPVTEKPTPKPTETATEKPTEPPKVSETAKIVTGIDISHWQSDRGKINWTQVKNDGIDYVIIKAAGRSISSSGSLYEDTAFKENIEGALTAGIPVGVYFFSQALTEQEAREEASLILGLIKDYKITYPVVFDWETSSGYRTYTAGLSKAKMNSIASTFCDMVKAAGYTPMVYGNGWDLTCRYDFDSLAAKYKIWLARYPVNYGGRIRYKVGDALPSGNYIPSTYQMWQYCSDGAVNGINGNVDVNVSFFSYSGTEVPTSAIKIDIPNNTITTNAGTAVNLMEGVTGFNTAGLEITDSITVTVNNSAGEAVTQEIAFNSSGTYTVSYSLRDFTGATKTVTATLIVRDAPVITLTTDTLIVKSSDAPAFIAHINDDTLKEYILSATDFEGNDISSNVTVVCDNALEQMLQSGKADLGTYTITFSVDDGTGLSTSCVLTVTITDKETSTSETASSSETTTWQETTSSPENSAPETTSPAETTTPVETTFLSESTTPAETTSHSENTTPLEAATLPDSTTVPLEYDNSSDNDE